MPARATVRCECGVCGAHVEVEASWQIAGWCRNCHSYDLRPLGAPMAAAHGPAPAQLDRHPARDVAFPVARVA